MKTSTEFEKRDPVMYSKRMHFLIARPLVGAIKLAACQPGERGRLRSCGSIFEGSRHLPKRSSIKGVRGAVQGLSGVMANSKDLQRGYSHPGTHVAECWSFGLRSSHSIRVPDRKDLVVRMSCCLRAYRRRKREGG